MMNKNTGQKVFDQDWFAKHQRPLVWLINTWLGRLIFRYRKMGHYPTNRIIGISPNSITEFVKYKKGGRVELRQHFFTRNEYARKLYFVLLPLWWAMHAWDTLFANRFAPQLNFGFDSLTKYPDADPETNTVDGRVFNNGADWNTIRGATDGSMTRDALTTDYFVRGDWTGAEYLILRGFFLFDTSSLDDAAVISDGVLTLYGDETKSDVNTTTIEIVASTPASDTALALGDFDQVGAVSFASMTIANWDETNQAPNNFTLNANGKNAISKTGISKFGTRCGRDFNNSTPTGYNYVHTYFADNATDKPKLVVTYTVPAAGPVNLKTLNTNLKANVKSYNTNLIANVKSINTNV